MTRAVKHREPSQEQQRGEIGALLGLLVRYGVMPQEVAFEIIGAVMNKGRPRLSRLRAWVDVDD